ncbi:MAG: AAA family ATPase [Verrucomicrobiota bacterium]
MPSLKYKLNDRVTQVNLKDRTRIGRSEANDLWIPAQSLSRHHAVVVREGDKFTLQDDGSTYGILVNGQVVRSMPLVEGAVFSLGEVEFTFSVAEAPAESAKATPIKVKIKGSEPVPETKPASSEPTPPPPMVTESKPEPKPELAKAETGKVPEPTVAATAPKPPTPPPAKAPEVKPMEVKLGGEIKLDNPTESIAKLNAAHKRILDEIGKIVIGQKPVLDEILTALFARGHCLLIGVPGLAKTLMVKALGSAIALDSKRIQFTPDLMPSDITGTDILEEDAVTGRRSFRFHKGPIFTNLLLADEINRTPPKTQAALLEAMQERRVTASGQTMDLPNPFMVLATQNPIEQEGTYPLPEAQLDRFMFCVHLRYPDLEDEQRVLLETTREVKWTIEQVLDGASIMEFQDLVRQVPVSEHVALYAMRIIRATRPDGEEAPDFIKRWVRWGAGTRAGQYLLLAAKARVLMQGRFSVSCADLRVHALPVLRHRIFCNFAAASEGVNTDDIVKKLLETVKEPDYSK